MKLLLAAGTLLAALLAGCSGDEPTADGRRLFEPARILVEPDGHILVVGIARLVGEGFRCGGEEEEIGEFTAVRIGRSGDLAGHFSLPQKENGDWCAEAVEEAVLLEDGGLAIGGSIRGPTTETGGDRGFVATRFARDGTLRQNVAVTHPTAQLAAWLLRRPPPLADEPPEIRGLAMLRDGGLAVGKYRDGLPNYTLFRLDRRGALRSKTTVRTLTNVVPLSVESARRWVYVLTEEEPRGDADYRYVLYRHRIPARPDSTFGAAARARG